MGNSDGRHRAAVGEQVVDFQFDRERSLPSATASRLSGAS